MEIHLAPMCDACLVGSGRGRTARAFVRRRRGTTAFPV